MRDKERLGALLEKAMVDCYGEHEEFAGVMRTLGDELRSPPKTTGVGKPAGVVGIDEGCSGLLCGIVARVHQAGQGCRSGQRS